MSLPLAAVTVVVATVSVMSLMSSWSFTVTFLVAHLEDIHDAISKSVGKIVGTLKFQEKSGYFLITKEMTAMITYLKSERFSGPTACHKCHYSSSRDLRTLQKGTSAANGKGLNSTTTAGLCSKVVRRELVVCTEGKDWQ